ncbi:MAG: hypothetical protein O7A08_14675 [SAR324 cluster bacterium]|nr:hypothetical protein [SAR324 cluster bacterium]
MNRPAPTAPALPEIEESAAMGELAECYADIRTVIGTAVVPLIYRHIATLPSVYRQLAHWPGFFPLAITLLESLEASGWLAATVAALRKDVGREVAQLAALLPWTALPMPQGTPRKSLEAIIERFTATGLMRILPTTKVLRATLPRNPLSTGA